MSEFLNPQAPIVDRGGLPSVDFVLLVQHFIRRKGTATWNPGNIANGASETTTVTVAGASLGWEASAAFSLDLTGLTLTAYVSAADTVTVVLANLTGGAVNLAEGTVTAWARQS